MNAIPPLARKPVRVCQSLASRAPEMGRDRRDHDSVGPSLGRLCNWCPARPNRAVLQHSDFRRPGLTLDRPPDRYTLGHKLIEPDFARIPLRQGVSGDKPGLTV